MDASEPRAPRDRQSASSQLNAQFAGSSPHVSLAPAAPVVPTVPGMPPVTPKLSRCAVVGNYVGGIVVGLLCCVVGPIFLIIGLVSPDDPETAGYVPIGIGITIAAVLLGLVLGFANTKEDRRIAALRAKGVRGIASVVRFARTDRTSGDDDLDEVTLSITAPGVEPFVVKRDVIRGYRSEYPRRVPIVVDVDPLTREYAIDWPATEQNSQTSA